MTARTMEELLREQDARTTALERRLVKSGGGSGGGGGTLAVGMMIDYPIDSPIPDYALACDGAAHSRTTYASLFGTIGTDYGVGDGSTTFNVPNLNHGAYAFSAYGTGTASKSGATSYSKATLGTELVDADGVYDASLSRFTAPVSGVYQLSIAGVQGPTNVTGPAMYFYKNGTQLAGLGDGAILYYNYVTGSRTINLSLAAGDYIEVWWANLNNTTASIDLVRTSFSGHLLSPREAYDTNSPTRKIIVATDQGSGVTIVQGGDGLGVGMVVFWPGTGVIPANCLESGTTYAGGAATYTALAAIYPEWVSGADLVIPDLGGKALIGKRTKSSIGTATMTIASPGVVTKSAHGLADGQRVSFTTTGALPTGVVATTRYFARDVTLDTFKLAATLGGTAIVTTGSQSGTHTLWDDDFTVVGESVGARAHRHDFKYGTWDQGYAASGPRAAMNADTDTAALRGGAFRHSDETFAGSIVSGSPQTMTRATPSAASGAAQRFESVGDTRLGSTMQPSYVGRWLVVAADAAGEYSPTVQAALTSSVLALQDKPIAKISIGASGSQTVNNSTHTDITALTTTVVAEGITVSSGTLIIVTAGWYRARASLVYPANGTGHRLVVIRKNGSGPTDVSSMIAYGPPISGTASVHGITVTESPLVYLEVGDVIRVNGWQNSGSNLALRNGTNEAWSAEMGFLSLEWVKA